MTWHDTTRHEQPTYCGIDVRCHFLMQIQVGCFKHAHMNTVGTKQIMRTANVVVILKNANHSSLSARYTQ